MLGNRPIIGILSRVEPINDEKTIKALSDLLGYQLNKKEAWEEELTRNIAEIKRLCTWIHKAGGFPMAPVLYVMNFLDEKIPEEREQGIQYCEMSIPLCDAAIINAVRGISVGMGRERIMAQEVGGIEIIEFNRAIWPRDIIDIVDFLKRRKYFKTGEAFVVAPEPDKSIATL